MIRTEKYRFECNDCGQQHAGDQVIYLCPACASSNRTGQPLRGVLKTLYDYPEIRKRQTAPAELFRHLEEERFLPLLPLNDFDSWPNLKIGDTPLYQVSHFKGCRDEHPAFHLYLKDDSQNPTFSFKDRASALVSAWAAEHGISVLAAASTGNAGSSLAGICAAQRQKAVIVVPAAAPPAKLTQILMYGALLIPVKGVYDDAFELSIRISEKYGWYNRNTAYNPLTIEGKKTVAFELFRDLGYRNPGRVFVPAGDGVILCGVYKGFEELLLLGIIDRMPEIVAVQAAGSPNIFMNLDKEIFTSVPSGTIADSISVDVPNNYHMSRRFLKTYSGKCLTVSDEEILQASVILASSTGIFSEPAASAAFAGMLKMRSEGEIREGSENVVLLTGSGLKDPAAMRPMLKMPESIDPDIDAASQLLSGL